MMKKSDLYREWARVLDMCESAGISTKNAWKFEGKFIGSDTPTFIEDPDGYEFLIESLEGKPVFVGNKLYLEGNIPYEVTNNTNPLWLLSRNPSWDPLKKTFMLNGVELPCPEDYTSDNNSILLLRACFDGINQTARFEFSNNNAKKVLDVLAKLLMENTK